MIEMKYVKTETVLDEIDWGNGRKFKCHSYWNDDTSFALDIGCLLYTSDAADE